MKHHPLRLTALLCALCATILLSACGPKASADPVTGPADLADGAEAVSTATLEELCGADYAGYISETILMQMENRMADQTPRVDYFPIVEEKPLSDYVTIDDTTVFRLDENGNPIIVLAAGVVAEEAQGEQTFAVPKKS